MSVWLQHVTAQTERLNVITAMTHLTRGADHFLAGWRKYGIEPLIVGLGDQFKGFVWKQRIILEAARGLTGLVLMADGYDTIPVRPPQDMIDIFIAMNSPLVMAAEVNCYPDASISGQYPECDTPYRYLNAGCWIADARIAVEVLQPLLCSHHDHGHDQGILAASFAANPTLFSLDHYCHLFQCLNGSAEHMQKIDGIYVNSITGSRPCILHGNGFVDLNPYIESQG